jgi:signal transduction histidine kinase
VKRPRFIRVRSVVVAVGVASTVIALVVALLIVGTVGASRNRQSQQKENEAVARVIANQIESEPRSAPPWAFRKLLVVEGQRLTITTPSGTVTLGARLVPGAPFLVVSVPIPGGTVEIASPIDTGLDPPIELVTVTLAVLLAVLASVMTANRLVSRRIRRRIDDTVSAAERVSLGDFTVRVGGEGPEPFARLGSAFDVMATRLEASDREQREFLADLAHEIATPVQALSGFSQAVIDGVISRESAESAIISQTSRLSDLLDNLSQLRGLDVPLDGDFKDVDVDELCESLYSEFGPVADESGVRFFFRRGHVVVRSDKKLVESVLRNFLTNAFRYTPSGERVMIQSKIVNDRVFITVSDTGPGIAPEHHQRIFDRFYRTAESRDRVTGGSGLGLTIARSAARSLGGHIELDSALGEGSTFRLVLPLHPSRPGRSEAPEAPDRLQ